MHIQLNEQGKYLRDLPEGNFEFSETVFQPARTLTPEQCIEFRVFALVATPQPGHDTLTQAIRAAHPKLIDSAWTQQWEIYPLPAEEVESNRTTKADQLRMELRAEYERRTAQIANPYPPSERESWPVQISEARELLADPVALTPWIDAAADARGIDRTQLAARIVTLDTAYRTIHGALTGARQRIEGLIDAAANRPDVMAALNALKDIDVKTGWPE